LLKDLSADGPDFSRRYAEEDPARRALLRLPGRHERAAASNARRDAAEIRAALRKLMWEKVGIVRNRKDLTTALKQLHTWERAIKNCDPDRNFFELKNMIATASLITRSALSREGSVGAHFRSDFPTKGRNWRKRTVIQA
jgi:aspartate oxidase